jgi:hypothetical protein
MPEINKPREMTLPAIRKRFDYGSWDHADCTWLYTRAEQHAEMLGALEAITAIGSSETCWDEFCNLNQHSPYCESVRSAFKQAEAAIRKGAPCDHDVDELKEVA